MTDIQQSVKYEEFMANISRRYIENCGEVFREDILEHAQKRAMVLREMLENLRRKYNELDALLGKFHLNSIIFTLSQSFSTTTDFNVILVLSI